MKKVLIGGLFVALFLIFFSCTGPLKSAADVELVVNGIDKDVTNLEVQIFKANVLYRTEKFDVTKPVVLKLEPGEYKAVVKAYNGSQLIAEGTSVFKVSDGVKTLSTTIFLENLTVTARMDALDRASMFKAEYVVTDTENNIGELRFDFTPQPGYKYYIYAKIGDAWVPLHEGIESVQGPMTVKGGFISVYGFKAVHIDDIEVFGIEVRTADGTKSSGIAPVVLFKGEKETGGMVRSVPAVLDATYVALCSDDGKLYILNYKDGLKEKVSYDVKAKGLMSPVVETIQNATHIFVAGTDGSVYNFVWRNEILTLLKRAPLPETARVEANPIVLNNKLYVLTYNGKIYAYTNIATSLTLAASKTLGEGVQKLITSPVADNEYIYFNFTKYNATTGKPELWIGRAKLSGSNIEFNEKKIGDVNTIYQDSNGYAATASSPILLNDYLYFGTIDGDIVKVHKQYFDYNIESLKTVKKFGFNRIDSSFVASGTNLYFGTEDGYIVSVKLSDLSVEWAYYTGKDAKGVKDAIKSNPLLGNDDTIYVGTYEGYVYALDTKDGKLKWRYQIDDRIWGSPALVDNKIIIGANNGKVVALKVASSGLASGSENWPKWRKDAKNSGRY